MRSMTGYGEAVREDGSYRYSVSIRSVNQRHLELQLRLPEELRSLERDLRAELSRHLARGRVEVRIFLDALGEREVTVTIRRGAIDGFRRSVADLVEDGSVDDRLSLVDLLRIPEAVVVDLVPAAWGDEHRGYLLSVLGEAVESLVAAREAEGASIREVLAARLETLTTHVRAIRERRGAVRGAIGETLRARIDEVLTAGEVDDTRLAQEVAVLVEKSDIAEELDRLDAHVERFGDTLGQDGALGKRLDFLTQEISRELNTVAAKGRDSEIVGLALDAKVVCEQLREQVQNVE